MIDLDVSTKKITEQKTRCYGFLVTDKGIASADLKACGAKLGVDVTVFLKQYAFEGKLMQASILPVLKGKELFHIIVVGLGKQDKKKALSIENYRRALAHLVRQVAVHKQKSFALQVPAPSLFDLSMEQIGQKTATIIHITSYKFDEFFSKENKKSIEISDVFLCVSSKDSKSFKKGIKIGEIVAQAMNKARHWVNMPPSDLTPIDLAKKAKAIAQKRGLKFTLFSEKQINEKGMGGLAAVGRGSDNDCQLAILEYKTSKKNAPTFVYVGKGITFDSGGLSLKPAVHMETMKEDMSGAAAVIATMEAIAQLKPNVNVIGITPLAENLPSGKATKPGDIVRFYNGKTAEVKNTDAEGRLVLADALAYATKHYKPDAIIDIATLTGACAYALGPFYTGLMSQHDDLVKAIEESALYSGDPVWRLPLSDDYAAAIKSDVADICNIGSQKYMAGSITAAHFLKNFVGDTPWAHLDIAGTAFNVPDRPYHGSGGTGVGVRLLIDLAQNFK